MTLVAALVCRRRLKKVGGRPRAVFRSAWFTALWATTRALFMPGAPKISCQAIDALYHSSLRQQTGRWVVKNTRPCVAMHCFIYQSYARQNSGLQMLSSCSRLTRKGTADVGQGRCAGHSPDRCLVINHKTCRVLLPLLVLIPIPCFALMFEQSLRKA